MPSTYEYEGLINKELAPLRLRTSVGGLNVINWHPHKLL